MACRYRPDTITSFPSMLRRWTRRPAAPPVTRDALRQQLLQSDLGGASQPRRRPRRTRPRRRHSRASSSPIRCRPPRSASSSRWARACRASGPPTSTRRPVLQTSNYNRRAAFSPSVALVFKPLGAMSRSTATSSRACSRARWWATTFSNAGADIPALRVDAVRGRCEGRLGQAHHNRERCSRSPSRACSPTSPPTPSSSAASSVNQGWSSTCSASSPRACACLAA